MNGRFCHAAEPIDCEGEKRKLCERFAIFHPPEGVIDRGLTNKMVLARILTG